jgi:secreted trypsin-like serine protease
LLRRAIVTAVALLALTATSASALVGGSPDNGQHPYVGAAVTPTPRGTELCSGILVGPTTFVTAAHCIVPGFPVLVVMRDVVAQPADSFGFAVTNPGWTVGGSGLSSFDRNDVAVVVLQKPLPGPYAQLPALGDDDALPNNQAVDVLGYGLTTPGLRQVAAAKVVPGGGVTAPWFLKVSAGTMCNGDSGGPVLKSGTNIALAINSYGASASCAAVGYAQRLDTADVLPWIRSFMG